MLKWRKFVCLYPNSIKKTLGFYCLVDHRGLFKCQISVFHLNRICKVRIFVWIKSRFLSLFHQILTVLVCYVSIQITTTLQHKWDGGDSWLSQRFRIILPPIVWEDTLQIIEQHVSRYVNGFFKSKTLWYVSLVS